ncbi:MAG: TetR/AcrR family transcriptional regulator [Actinomycetota bacterium]|nr:TetR/AcrR family transcriptional regulator [Actinomycetota bacterium]
MHYRTVLGNPDSDWRENRREAARAEIVDQAWSLARQTGLLGFSMRDLARVLGMAAPSLYSYFDSKHALYDAMYADGYRGYLALDRLPAGDLRSELLAGARRFACFGQADPVRYQLLFQRTIPDFAPTPSSYSLAQEAYERDFAASRLLGLSRQRDLDLVTGVISGLVAQQLANEPDSDRWLRLLDDAVDMLVHHVSSAGSRTRPRELGDVPPRRRRRRSAARSAEGEGA